MLEQCQYEKLFSDEFLILIRTICQRKQWDIHEISRIFEGGFRLNDMLKKSTQCDDSICMGLVTTNNSSRRCTRNKSRGDLCGLHYNKEVRDGHIERYTKNVVEQSDKRFYITPTNTSTIDNACKLHPPLDMDDILNDSDTDDEFLTIYWGQRELKLDCRTNVVYTEGIEGDIKIGMYNQQQNTIVYCT